MDVEVFIHGVPNGESFWGKDEDRNYFGNFYDQSCSDKVKFLVQTRLSNGKAYCYYNYLVYGNVVGYDGREGSYFGLSIRFDAYCKNFMSVYKVLDAVFCSTVVNNILKVQAGNYKYVIPDFVNVPDVMKNINSRIWELIQSALTGESFCSLKGFNTNSSQLPSVNLYETTSSDVETMVRQYGKIAISPYYQTSSERALVQQYEERLNTEKQQCEARIKANATAAENMITQNQNELSSLRTNNSNLATKIAEQNKTIENLNAKIREFNLIKKSVEIIEDVKEPIMELASVFGYKSHKGSARGDNGSLGNVIKSVIPWINTILGVVIIVILTFPSEEKSASQNDDLIALKDTISILRADNEEFRCQLHAIEKSKDNVTTGNVDRTFATGGYDNSKKPASVDVADYNEKQGIYLKTGKTYKASVQNSNNANGHQWTIKGGRIIGSANGATVSFTPTSEDYITYVTLVYVNLDGEHIERKLKVQKP